MNKNRNVIVRNLHEIPYETTSHNIGQKQVLLSDRETESKVTQIANNRLQSRSIVERHAHPSMDEHFIFLSGNGEMIVGDTVIKCIPGRFVLVPANIYHSIAAQTELHFITLSIGI